MIVGEPVRCRRGRMAGPGDGPPRRLTETDVAPRRSALIVPIELPAKLEAVRAARTTVAGLGVPAHVTLLVPWLEPRAIGRAEVAGLRRITAAEPAFEVELDPVRTFPADARSPGTVYLAPDPTEPFVRLTGAITAAYPDHPPYGGLFDTIVAHLTVADDAGLAAEVAAIAATVLPVRRRVSEASLIVEGDDGRWTRRARLALGRSTRVPAGASR
jgi:2'-5' RNA ligase